MAENSVDERITQLEARIEKLEGILAQKETPVKRGRKKKSDTEKVDLDKFKRDFWNSVPQNRTDFFTDKELVLWGAYLLVNTSRKEIIGSFAEIGKRTKRIKKIIEYYAPMWNKDLDADLAPDSESYARYMTKHYLQYLLWEVPTWIDKDGPVTMTFYVATSDWAINSYGAKVYTYIQEKRAESKMRPFEDD